MDVKLPHLGDGADSGTVVGILVKSGASVKKGQNIIELETGKAVAPIPAPADGKVSRIAVKEGDKLGVGGLILVLETAESGASAASTSAEPAAANSFASAPKPSTPAPRKAAGVESVSAPEAQPDQFPQRTEDESEFVEAIVNENPAAGPYVRRVARDLGLDLRVISGSGKSGQIIIGDLKAYVAQLHALASRPRVAPVIAAPASGSRPEPPVACIDFSQWGPIQRKALTPLRKTIAARMVESATTLPAVTQFDEADITSLHELRGRQAAEFEAKGVRLTMTSYFVKAVASVLRKHPILNASLDMGVGEVVYKDYVHIGLAVDTESGLLVPVIRDADKKDLLTLSREIQELAQKARERKLSLAEMQGGTFTISNQGGIGGGHFTPIINKPEVAILGLGRSLHKPVVRDGQIVSRLVMPLALTYDHRLIDGGAAARFTVDLVKAFEAGV